MAKREQKPAQPARRAKDAERRVDPAHALGDAPLPAPADTASVAPISADVSSVHAAAETSAAATIAAPAVELVQRVRSHAGQLADHLRRQQSGLDHRESELNARESHVESQVRSARLWLRERQEELQARQADLDLRERELAARENRIRAAEDVAGQAATAQQAVPARGVQRTSTPSSPAPEGPSADDERIARRADQLDAAEKLLVREQAELDQARAAFVADREAWDNEVRSERRQLAELERGLRLDAKRQEESHQRRAEQLEARRAALDALRDETVRTQHETLEMRLATEEVWTRLSGQAPPAELTQSLALVRLKLADQQRLAMAALVAKHRELDDLSAQIAARHERLTAERTELTTWHDRRQSELAQSATALAAKEAELDGRAAQLASRAEEWTAERRRLQAEIRHLLKELRGVSLVAR